MLLQRTQHFIWFSVAILIGLFLVGCGTATAQPTPTLEPTNSPAPTATAEPTNTPEPSATPEPTNTATPEATETPEPTETPEAEPTEAPLFSQDGEELEDGWIRYTVPESYMALELPSQFFTLRLQEEMLDSLFEELETLMPEASERYDIQSLFEQNVRLFALDVETDGNISAISINVGEVPLEFVVDNNLEQLKTIIPEEDIQEPVYLTVDGTDAARVDYQFPVGDVVVGGAQLYLMADGYLQIVTISYPETVAETYAPLIEEIFQRINVLDGIVS